MFGQLFTIFATGCKTNFLGLIPWYQYLKLNSSCDVSNFNLLPNGSTPSDIPLILLAVVDDLLRIAGLVAIAYIIIGAIQYITSQGNPEETAKAQSTIVNALVGLAIAMVAVVFVSFLGNKLGG